MIDAPKLNLRRLMKPGFIKFVSVCYLQKWLKKSVISGIKFGFMFDMTLLYVIFWLGKGDWNAFSSSSN